MRSSQKFILFRIRTGDKRIKLYHYLMNEVEKEMRQVSAYLDELHLRKKSVKKNLGGEETNMIMLRQNLKTCLQEERAQNMPRFTSRTRNKKIQKMQK